jgi:DNA-binding transcriptional LysR family regulator
MNVTLRQLQGFRTVAELGSFTRAAQRLQMAQPALSLSIRELEAELKIRLFDRTTRRVELTTAGREFLQSTEKLIADLEHSIRNVRDLTDRKRGRLTIAAPPLLAAMIVPAAIADYKRAFPGIEVRLIDTQTDIIVAKVQSGEVDCAVGTFSETEQGIRQEVLLQDNLAVWCAPGSPAAKQPRIKWSELQAWPLIMMSRASNIRSIVERACETAGHSPRPAFEVSQMTTAVMLVEAGLGVSVLPTYIWSFARSRKVIAKPLIEPQVQREVSFIQSDSRSASPAVEGFSKFLRKHARASLPRNLRNAL